MADLKIEKCCGVEPDLMVFEHVVVASCPVCGHRSFPIPPEELEGRVLRYYGGVGELSVKCWNRGVRAEKKRIAEKRKKRKEPEHENHT